MDLGAIVASLQQRYQDQRMIRPQEHRLPQLRRLLTLRPQALLLETTRATAAEATKQPLLATSSTVPVSCTSGSCGPTPPNRGNNVGAVCYSNVWYYLQTIMSGTPNTPIVDSGTPTSTYPAYVAGSTDGMDTSI